MIDNLDIKSRCVLLAEYMVDNSATVRSCASAFGISKSTVHKDVTEKLKNTNYTLYTKVKKILERNKAERHLRGGEATRMKFSQRKHNNTKTGK
ncbi:MAG: sporulation transcriptional regulator SpoIIID [Clostridia bacterium]|nr:sporulation transcriptional regulator SpoIIID [Clostridia bacterium]